MDPRCFAALRARGAPLPVLVLLVLLSGAACVNFHAVEPGRVYRSGQPSEHLLTRWIWRHGIQTVVRLRGGDADHPSWRASYRPTEKAGIDFVQLPMSARAFPSKAQLTGLCDLFENARYPLLLHCWAGADRTGLASAVYVLHRTGDLAAARAQLSLEYLHVGWPETWRLDHVLDLYEPWQDRLTFCEWARQVYQRPGEEAEAAAAPEARGGGARAEQEGAAQPPADAGGGASPTGAQGAPEPPAREPGDG